MDDVAKLAGVSAQTVSRAIGRPELVKEATRLAVQRAISQLNYIPNNVARDLASRRSHTVAVIIPTLATSVYAEEVNQIMAVLLTALIGNSEFSIEREEQLIESFLQRRPDGFILTGLKHSRRSRQLLRMSGAPVVETWEADGSPLDMSVGFSNVAVGQAVGRSLIRQGYRRIGFVGGMFDTDTRSHQRYAGCASALSEDGVEFAAVVELLVPMSSADAIQGLDLALAKDGALEAIFFSSDGLAIPALLECQRRGIDVPGRLAICGVGDYELAELVSPPLTTVRIETGKMGSSAATLILQRLSGLKDIENRLDIGFELIKRGST